MSLFGGPQVSIRDNIFNGGPYDPNCGYDCLTDVPEIGVRWNGDVGTNGATAPNTFNAECNWWGVASGPGINDAPGVPGATTVTLGVDATPWNITNSGSSSGS